MAVQIVNFTQDELGPAWALRKQIDAIPSMGIGVIDLGDMLVTAGSGFGVNIATGTATVRQTVASEGGGSNAYYNAIYTAFNDGSASPYNTVSAPLTNPRLDSVILRIYDVQEQGLGGASYGRFEWLPGAETVGATLDNRSGAASLPANSLLLADAIQTVGEAGTGTIRDRRPLATLVSPPSVKTSLNAVSFVPVPALVVTSGAGIVGADNGQRAAAMFLPRRIVGATKIRWSYTQGGTAATGSYNLGLYDASGRSIVDTGAVAWTGAASSNQVRAETIAATTLEAGIYYVVIGYNTSAGSFTTNGAAGNVPSIPNVLLYLNSGSTTLPTTILGFTDTFGTPLSQMVPLVALSVT